MGTDKRARQKAGRAARLAQEAQTQQRDQRKRLVVGFVVVVALVAGFAAIVLATQKKPKKTATTGTSTTVAGATTLPPTTAPPTTVKGASGPGDVCPAADGSSKRTLNFTSSPKTCLTGGKTYTATFKTNVGSVEVQLDTSKAPKAVNSFVFLSRYHYYDATALFRVNTGIDIIQGGSPHTQTNADGGPGYTLTDEPTFTNTNGQLKGPYTYKAGDLALANTGQPNSAGAQFFFITGPGGAGLDAQGTYMVIGHVTSGLPILQNIVKTATASTDGSGEATPKPAVTIESVTITEK